MSRMDPHAGGLVYFQQHAYVCLLKNMIFESLGGYVGTQPTTDFLCACHARSICFHTLRPSCVCYRRGRQGSIREAIVDQCFLHTLLRFCGPDPRKRLHDVCCDSYFVLVGESATIHSLHTYPTYNQYMCQTCSLYI